MEATTLKKMDMCSEIEKIEGRRKERITQW